MPPPIEPEDAVDRALAGTSGGLEALAGLRVAVCVGSRGVDNIVPVTKRVVERMRGAGAADAEALEAALASIHPCAAEDIGIVRIKNTMELETLQVSRAYREEVQSLEHVQILGEFAPPLLDGAGMLKPMV